MNVIKTTVSNFMFQTRHLNTTEEADSYIAEVEAYEKEQEEYAEEIDKKIAYIKSMSKTDLQQALYELLCDAPEIYLWTQQLTVLTIEIVL